MVGTDPGVSRGPPDISDLFCHYNALYFDDSLGACAVCWAEEPLRNRDVSTCDYYPGGGGCIILLSKSLYKCHNDSDLKNALLHEMIHAYICIKENNNNHSDHGAKFQKLMNTVNLNSVDDPHRPVEGYSITTLHEIRKKYYHKCERCGDVVRSTKMRVPSPDDCIENIGSNGPCQNSKCQWHRHRSLCPGSYYRVQESAPGTLEHLDVKRPKVEEALDEGKAEEPDCKIWHPPHTSNKSRTGNKNKQGDADDAIGSSGLDLSPRDKSGKKIKLAKDVSFDLPAAETIQEGTKRPRTAAQQSQRCSRRKQRKLRGHPYSVIIEWLNYYCYSDSDEDEIPLINKRTEQRKWQKLRKMSVAREFGVKCPSAISHAIKEKDDAFVGSCSLDPGDSSHMLAVPASQSEEIWLPNHAVCSHGVTGNQVGNGSVSSPLDSPVRGEIVEISDG